MKVQNDDFNYESVTKTMHVVFGFVEYRNSVWFNCISVAYSNVIACMSFILRAVLWTLWQL